MRVQVLGGIVLLPDCSAASIAVQSLPRVLRRRFSREGIYEIKVIRQGGCVVRVQPLPPLFDTVVARYGPSGGGICRDTFKLLNLAVPKRPRKYRVLVEKCA